MAKRQNKTDAEIEKLRTDLLRVTIASAEVGESHYIDGLQVNSTKLGNGVRFVTVPAAFRPSATVYVVAGGNTVHTVLISITSSGEVHNESGTELAESQIIFLDGITYNLT